jgi:hypothetical protein
MKTVIHEKVEEAAPAIPAASAINIPAAAPPTQSSQSKTDLAAEAATEDPKSAMPVEANKQNDEAVKPSVSVDDSAINIDSAATGASKTMLPTPAGATASTLQTPILNEAGVADSPSLETVAKEALLKKRKASKDLTKEEEKAVDLEAGAPPTAFLG